MTNTALFEDVIKKSGYKYLFLDKKLGIFYQALRNKLDNKNEFLPTEIEKLCVLLSINNLELKNDIFLQNLLNKYQQTNKIKKCLNQFSTRKS